MTEERRDKLAEIIIDLFKGNPSMGIERAMEHFGDFQGYSKEDIFILGAQTELAIQMIRGGLKE